MDKETHVVVVFKKDYELVFKAERVTENGPWLQLVNTNPDSHGTIDDIVAEFRVEDVVGWFEQTALVHRGTEP